MEMLKAAEIIGKSVRAIEDRGEIGFSPVEFESAKNHPMAWLRQSEFWIRRYNMDLGQISQAVNVYADCLASHDASAVDAAMGRLFIAYLQSPEKS